MHSRVPEKIKSKWSSLNFHERAELCSIKFGLDLSSAMQAASDQTGETLSKLWTSRQLPSSDPPKYRSARVEDSNSKTTFAVLSPVSSKAMAVKLVLGKINARAQLLCDLEPPAFSSGSKHHRSQDLASVGDSYTKSRTPRMMVSPLRACQVERASCKFWPRFTKGNW